MADVTIKVLDKGPYMVDGPAQLLDGAGKPLDRSGPHYLCRCGQSRQKPFCDGAHVGKLDDCTRWE